MRCKPISCYTLFVGSTAQAYDLDFVYDVDATVHDIYLVRVVRVLEPSICFAACAPVTFSPPSHTCLSSERLSLP